MKIAMLGHKRIPSREGGVEIVVEELASRMTRIGHDVTVYNRKGQHVADACEKICNDKKWDYNGIHIITVPTFEKKSLNAIVYALLATLKLLGKGYDIIHYHAEGPCAMLPIAKKLTRAKCIATIHGLDWQRSKWGGFATQFLLFGEKMAAKYADEIIVLSENVQKYFMDTYGRETVYIPNGVNRPRIYDAEIIKDKYGLEKDSYILFLARLVPEKGLHYLIDAYQELHTDKKLVIAGGSSHTTEYVEEIRKQVAGNPNIIMTGFVQGQELGELYSNAYIYTLPSDLEGMPLSLLEAMSYGNCCVTSNIPECANVMLQHGVTFEKGNVDALAEKLQRLCDNAWQVKTYQETSADYICDAFNWEDVTAKTLALYGVPLKEKDVAEEEANQPATVG